MSKMILDQKDLNKLLFNAKKIRDRNRTFAQLAVNSYNKIKDLKCCFGPYLEGGFDDDDNGAVFRLAFYEDDIKHYIYIARDKDSNYCLDTDKMETQVDMYSMNLDLDIMPHKIFNECKTNDGYLQTVVMFRRKSEKSKRVFVEIFSDFQL